MNIEKEKIKKYLFIVLLISGVFFTLTILLIKLKLASYPDLLTGLFGMIGILSPTIASLILMNKKLNIKNITSLTFNHKKKTFHYVLMFLVLYTIVFLLTRTYDKEFPFMLIIPLFLYAVTFGGGFEEYGWRGVLQTNLEKITSYPVSSIITGIIWAIWHIPVWIIQGVEINFTIEGIASLLLFILGCIEMSFILGYIYKKTNSIFYCALLHGLYNTLTTIFISHESLTWSTLYEIINLLIAIFAIIMYYKKDKTTN
jgi:membrane protease YdiL (CAAX protease family)